MKKKIVYISGAEVFDVNDVRAAFDEVRNALKLGTDTILFGVPVDNDEAAFNQIPQTSTVEDSPNVDLSVDTESVNQEPAEPEPSKELKENVDFVDVVPAEEPVVETTEIVEEAVETEHDAPESVVPILSVLASKEEETEITAEPEPKVVKETKPKPKKTRAKKTVVESVEPQLQDPDMSDILNDEMPAEPGEKTLEELLETMEPLREDNTIAFHEKNNVDDAPITVSEEIDVTLEKLAGEFAENQDKVSTNKKGSDRGKIGKLKSILPFKKMKRDDTGLMGDLFGWAGIAANDDDFTMPGFFK